MAVVAGIDVGKANLDVSISEGPVFRFENTAKGIAKLLKHLKEQDTTMAVCESAGGYERLLVSRLRKTEIRMDIAHPSRVRAFARACGYEAKTDPQDALVLSRFGQVFPEQTPPGWELEPELEELQDLLRRRCQLVEQRVQELSRLDKGVAPAVAKSTKRHIVWLEKEIARLNQEYQAALQSSAPMARRAALYRTVPGVGALTAATLVAHLPELGHWDSKALTSLVGVAPGVTSLELWELRNSLLHMTNLDSKKVRRGSVERLKPVIINSQVEVPSHSGGYKNFHLTRFTATVLPQGIDKWIRSYNEQPAKLLQFIHRYDTIVSEARLSVIPYQHA